MIPNAYAILDAFVSVLRIGVGAAVVVLAVRALTNGRSAFGDAEARSRVQDRRYLMYLLAGLLVALNVLAWPLFYLLLQSYVAEWPGVMCIYGVTQIGRGSLGASRHLPGLVIALEAMKPTLIFLSGVGGVLYALDRTTTTAPLARRVAIAVLIVGGFAVVEAVAEVVYLAIPKSERFLAVGCCTDAADPSGRWSRFHPRGWLRDADAAWLIAGFYAMNAGLIVVLGLRSIPRAALPVVLAADVLALLVSALFLVEVAAPRLLRMPFHHCPYDLIPRVPESVVAGTLYLTGSFAVGWACVADWFGRHAETAVARPRVVARLLRLGFLAYLGSLVMLSVELALS